MAIVFASSARKRIAQDPGLGGADMARAGMIIGWIGLVLAVIVVVFLIVLAFTISKSNF